MPQNEPDFFNEGGDKFLEEPFLMTELDIALDKCNPKSSLGCDGIDYQILKKFPQKLRELLLNLYNEIYLTGSFPNEWREYTVFLYLKATPKKFARFLGILHLKNLGKNVKHETELVAGVQ